MTAGVPLLPGGIAAVSALLSQVVRNRTRTGNPERILEHESRRNDLQQSPVSAEAVSIEGNLLYRNFRYPLLPKTYRHAICQENEKRKILSNKSTHIKKKNQVL
jgi:hypothetical protein